MRYLITFSYDGSKYFGYQKQKGVNSVQEDLEKVLSLINNKPVSVCASGRTDAGVHANGQCAHFDIDISITPDKLKNALNGLLNGNIYVKSVVEVPDTFHARFDVKQKEYIYKINTGEYSPIYKDYIYQYCKPLDVDSMKTAIKSFEGEHNFKSFTKANVETNNFARTIYSTAVTKDNDIITIAENYRESVLNKNKPEINIKSSGDYQASLANMLLSRYIQVQNIYLDSSKIKLSKSDFK